jgi:hypothetical protein
MTFHLFASQRTSCAMIYNSMSTLPHIYATVQLLTVLIHFGAESAREPWHSWRPPIVENTKTPYPLCGIFTADLSLVAAQHAVRLR